MSKTLAALETTSTSFCDAEIITSVRKTSSFSKPFRSGNYNFSILRHYSSDPWLHSEFLKIKKKVFFLNMLT